MGLDTDAGLKPGDLSPLSLILYTHFEDIFGLSGQYILEEKCS